MPTSKMTMITMSTGFDELDRRINELVEQEKECDDLFREIQKGNGEKSIRYITLRDACKELRKGIFRNAMSAGLTRDKIKTEIQKVRGLNGEQTPEP